MSQCRLKIYEAYEHDFRKVLFNEVLTVVYVNKKLTS